MKQLTIVFLFLIFGCEQKTSFPSADEIVAKAIAEKCSGNCEQVEIQFDFRGRTYKSRRTGGLFQYERITPDSLGILKDVLDNTSFHRYRNDSLLVVADSMAAKYANSVNSVHYFSQLPYGLNDPAVIKELVDTTSVKGEPYYRVKVRFQKEGGGKDFEDEFLYWIHRTNYTVDFLAYNYITDGGGVRFREAYNPRVLEGIRFVDYRNYKPNSKETTLESLDSLFVNGELKLLSSIENTNISVRLID